ncbi:MAG: Siz/PIAS RING finger protein [Candidatus Omnitrophota bacterium]
MSANLTEGELRVVHRRFGGDVKQFGVFVCAPERSTVKYIREIVAELQLHATRPGLKALKTTDTKNNLSRGLRSVYHQVFSAARDGLTALTHRIMQQEAMTAGASPCEAEAIANRVIERELITWGPKAFYAAVDPRMTIVSRLRAKQAETPSWFDFALTEDDFAAAFESHKLELWVTLYRDFAAVDGRPTRVTVVVGGATEVFDWPDHRSARILDGRAVTVSDGRAVRIQLVATPARWHGVVVVDLRKTRPASEIIPTLPTRATFNLRDWRIRGGVQTDAGTVEDSDEIVPLTCPITLVRPRIPARGLFCRHLRCFDVEVFVAQQMTASLSQRRAWKCPLCSSPCAVDKLYIDLWFKDLVDRAPAGVGRVIIGAERTEYVRDAADADPVAEDDDGEPPFKRPTVAPIVGVCAESAIVLE